MPDIDLDAIKARADAATPGPWRAALVSAYEDDDGQQRGKGGIYPGTEPGPPPLFLTMDWLATDAEFIAHAREDVPALLDLIHHLATDGGNRAAAYWLRAHDAEKERDEAEAEADRLRGLLAEACDEHHDDILTRYATLEDDHGITPDSAEGHAYFTGYQDGLSAGERQKADAWDEGYDECEAPHFIDRRNPYRGQQ